MAFFPGAVTSFQRQSLYNSSNAEQRRSACWDWWLSPSDSCVAFLKSNYCFCAWEKLNDFLGTGCRSGPLHIAREIWTCLILDSDICERRILQWTAAMIADTRILALYGMQMRPQTLAHAWGDTISYYQLNQAQSFSSYNDPHGSSVMHNGADFSLMEVKGCDWNVSVVLSLVLYNFCYCIKSKSV